MNALFCDKSFVKIHVNFAWSDALIG